MSTDMNSLSIDQGNDGSLETAAQLMPDFGDEQIMSEPEDQEKQRRIQKRHEDGKWTEGFEKAQAQAQERAKEPIEAEVEATAEGDGPDDAANTGDEWFEIPGDKEGDEPKRIKVDEVWQGYQEREQLREQIEKMQRVLPPPPQYDEQIYQTVQTRGRLVQELNVLMQANQPIEPDISLIDELSPRYNPGEYHRQVALQRDMAQRHHKLRERQAYEQHHLSQEQEALTAARRSREQSKLVEFWPELRDPVVQRQVRDDAARYFGIDGGTLDSVMDARFYAILKHALDNVNGQKQRQQAVKVVRAKPKVVRGSARDTNGKQQQIASSMKRLQSTNSAEDAAEAFGALNF